MALSTITEGEESLMKQSSKTNSGKNSTRTSTGLALPRAYFRVFRFPLKLEMGFTNFTEAFHAALIILKHEKFHDVDEKGDNSLTCLQRRCTKAINNELWKTRSQQLWRLVYPTPADVLNNLRELKPVVLRTVYEHSPPVAHQRKRIRTMTPLEQALE